MAGKSYNTNSDVAMYCLSNSSAMHPAQVALQEETIKMPRYRMLGAPEVLAMNAAMIRSKKAKKVLDIGVFTGASSLAAALAFDPEEPGCRVVACDITDTYSEICHRYWKMAGVDDKIDFVVGPASDTLAKLIEEDGAAGTFDFAFVDADKVSYLDYFRKCMVLLKPGGCIAFDNTLWSLRVLPNSGCNDEDTVALRELNSTLAKEPGVHVVQLNIGDGYTLVVKI